MVGKSWGEGFLKWWSQVLPWTIDYTGGSNPMDPGPSGGNRHVEAGTWEESLFPYSAPSVWGRGSQQGDMTAVLHIEAKHQSRERKGTRVAMGRSAGPQRCLDSNSP